MKKSKFTIKYRLGIDLGTNSLGWAVIKLNDKDEPTAIIKAGTRIFSDGRVAKDGTSLAAARRGYRSQRRRRDRFLRRRADLIQLLVDYGFLPNDLKERRELANLNPYEIRARGLDKELTPYEFGRILIHLNERRGFKSNRKVAKDEDSGALKRAISELRQAMISKKCRTVGEFLYKRLTNSSLPPKERTVRARPIKKGKTVSSYPFYIDRQMIADEFNLLWDKQSQYNTDLYSDEAYSKLEYKLLNQRELKAVLPGLCTLLADQGERRAALALPSTQKFRIYQELNNLQIIDAQFKSRHLSRDERDSIYALFKGVSHVNFTKIRRALSLPIDSAFNLQSKSRDKLLGNLTENVLSQSEYFGSQWYCFSEDRQEEIVSKIIGGENDQDVLQWLQQQFDINDAQADTILNAPLPQGYANLSTAAIQPILKQLINDVITYDKAVQLAGFAHHSVFEYSGSAEEGALITKTILGTGEVKEKYRFHELPYYGKPLQRFVGVGSGNPQEIDEKRYGKIANPTVHIGLNQLRLVVNKLIQRYGHPAEVVVELARNLKLSQKQKRELKSQQKTNQKRNERVRTEIAKLLHHGNLNAVKPVDLTKWILWEELAKNPLERKCPYTGEPISTRMLLSEEVEIDHILPFSRTLDNSRNNKLVCLRRANRDKGNKTPSEAFKDQQQTGYDYESMLLRVALMPKPKQYRFGSDAIELWLKNDAGFLARALNDTAYLSRLAKEYLNLICPFATRVIPGHMTALLRAKFGLNTILGGNGSKNRNDHRHHAIDACVIAVTDQGLLQRFAKANASAVEAQLNRLVNEMPLPWKTFREHVARAVGSIKVSHRPDHNYEGQIFTESIYSPQGYYKTEKGEIKRTKSGTPFKPRPNQKGAILRHGGSDKIYKQLKTDSNYCIEIFRQDDGQWGAEVISTHKAYKIKSYSVLRNPKFAQNGKPLIMRLCKMDYIYCEDNGTPLLLKVVKISSDGSVAFTKANEANVSARYSARLAARKKQGSGEPFDSFALNDDFYYKSYGASSLKRQRARRVTVCPLGNVYDPGFKP